MKSYVRKSILFSLTLVGGGLLALRSDFFEINKQLELFNSVYREVHLNYVDEPKPGQLMETAIESMLADLDPYTNYIPERLVEDFRAEHSGHYGGIGANVGLWKGDYVTITNVAQGFSADKAGIKPGDDLVEADGVSLLNKSEEDVINLLKGSPGTTVQLKVRRGKEMFTLPVKRDDVQVKSVPYFKRTPEGFGYVILNQFTEKASREVRAALEEMQRAEPLKGIVLDLRGNPGGLLSEAVNIVGLFVPKGTEVVSTRGRLEEAKQTYRTLDKPLFKDLPLVVVVDRGSASASEIVAGSLQDLDRAVVVGQRSFGKGLVQQNKPLAYGAQLKVTVSKYYTPSGRCIQAINYAERNEDGSVSRVPDSLRTAFETKGGRTVYDGGGVDPDVFVEPIDYPEVLRSIYHSGQLFDWVTDFAASATKPQAAEDFRLSEQQYNQFVQQVAARKSLEYKPDTERFLDFLKEAAESDGYMEQIKSEYDQLVNRFVALKKEDLKVHQKIIQPIVEEEIVSRYFYQEGRLALSASRDTEIMKAFELLADSKKYGAVFEKN